MRSNLRGLWAFARRTLHQADRHNIPFLASALTFDALLAAIPFLVLVLVGLTLAARLSPASSATDLQALFQRLLPPTEDQTAGSYAVLERVLLATAHARAALSLYAIPLFLWFATRLFASIRISLTLLYDVPPRPGDRHFLLSYLAGKARDVVMVLVTVAILAINGFLTTGLHIVQMLQRGIRTAAPELGLSARGLGHLLSELIAFGFAVTLFYLVYRHAAPRRLRRRAALAGSVFTALLVEVAKRLYGWYLAHLAMASQVSTDANITALILFVLWLYYAAIVFLLGAIVAETWDLRARQQAAVVP